ncbi:MAG TPA: hypothetical protein VE395_04640 [Acidimicrobiales bacterium]|nr:hypothetical protein [Acidimicrobiales bacterium]
MGMSSNGDEATTGAGASGGLGPDGARGATHGSAEPSAAGPATDVQERARQGIEHLQAAARELIEAARAALDVAEELVNDPESVASLAGVMASVGDLARRVSGAGGWAPAGGRGSHAGTVDGEEAPARVEHIPVT